MLAHESSKISKSSRSISRTSGTLLISFNGINNLVGLGGMRWRSTKWPMSPSWLNLSLALVLCLIIILDSSTVAGYPASPSRSYRDAKNIPSTTLHSLQQGVDSGSSLSIVSSLDVLRQNMVLEIVRRRIRHAKQRQLQSNKEILDRIG